MNKTRKQENADLYYYGKSIQLRKSMKVRKCIHCKKKIEINDLYIETVFKTKSGKYYSIQDCSEKCYKKIKNGELK